MTQRRWYWVTHNGVDSLWDQAPDGSCHELCTMAQYAQPDEARLIAAAPDLLATCEALLARCGSLPAPSLWMQEIIAAEMAVEKAKERAHE